MHRLFRLFCVLSLGFLWTLQAARADIPTDCNTLSDTPSESFVCTYPQLKKINLQLKGFLDKAKGEVAAGDLEKLENYVYAKNIAVKSCKNSYCLVEIMKEIYTGIAEKKYLSECIKPEIDAACDVYVVGDQNKVNLNKDLYLSEAEHTSMRKLRVNLPGKCVYLIINNLFPAVWDIYATPETDIKEIFATGDFPQMIRGFDTKTKVTNHNKNENIKDNKCLSEFIDITQIQDKLSELGFDKNKVKILSEDIIGQTATQNSYVFHQNNVSGNFINPPVLPGDKGIQLLEREGKLRRATQADLKAISDIGFYTLGGSEFVWGKDKYRQSFGPFDNNYLILGDIELMPNLNTVFPAPKLFFAKGVALPKNLDLRLGGVFASVFRINADAENFSAEKPETGTKTTQRNRLIDCNNDLNILESYICNDKELRESNFELNLLLNQQSKETQDIMDAFVDFYKLRLSECSSRDCLTAFYQQRRKWLESGEAAKLLPQNIPSRCQLGDLPPDCEIYAYSIGEDQGMTPLPNLYLNDEHETFNQKMYINRPGKCVALFLSGHDPIVWDIYTTPETDLRAVVAGGFYQQMLRGMDGKVITKNRHGNYIQTGNDVCLPIDYDAAEIVDAVKDLYLGDFEIKLSETNYIGDKLPETAYNYNPEIMNGEFVTPDLLPGEKGLHQLLKAGKIRKGRKTDVTKLKAVGFEYMGGSAPAEYAMDEAFQHGVFGFYIMLENFEKLPKGLAGANSISLFVPKDLIAPDNNGGHSNFYKVNAEASELKADTANQQTNPEDEIDIQKAEEKLSQLEAEGKIRKEILRPQNNDYDRIIKAGYEYIKGSIPKDNIEGYAFRNIYIMLDNFPELPRGFDKVSAPHLFIPRGLTPPEPNGFSSLFWINAPIEEVRQWK